MAITIAFERWNGYDHLSATDLLTSFTSGTIGSAVSGLRGEGQAISLPTNLLLVGSAAGGAQIIVHNRIRYDQDDSYFLQIYTATGTGPYLQIASGTVTAHRSDGALIGTCSNTWPSGRIQTVSMAVSMANSATGSIKVWFDSSVVLNLTSVQTVPSAGSTVAVGVYINGFGVWDDQGLIYGTGSWVDADVPLKQWCRTQHANAVGTFNQWTPQGSGSTHVDRVSETIANGDTNTIDYAGGNDGTIEGFKMTSMPSNVTTVWGVQHEVFARQNGGALVRGLRLMTRDGGGQHNNSGSFSLTNSYAPYFKFLRLNGSSAAWDATSFNATEFECTLTS